MAPSVRASPTDLLASLSWPGPALLHKPFYHRPNPVLVLTTGCLPAAPTPHSLSLRAQLLLLAKLQGVRLAQGIDPATKVPTQQNDFKDLTARASSKLSPEKARPPCLLI